MSYLITDVSDGIATLTINDPDKRNAINLMMCEEIITTMETLENDGRTRW